MIRGNGKRLKGLLVVWHGVVWAIWRVRNDVIFNSKVPVIEEAFQGIISLSWKWLREKKKKKKKGAVTQSSNPRLVTWARPMEGTICLNVDGNLLGSLNYLGYGGLLRNHNGEFILGFYGTTSLKSILFAEIMVVLHGLTICWENGYRKINCLSNSLQLVNLIRSGVSLHHRFANEILSIRRLITRDWEVVLSHTLREGNSCADVLAKMGVVANTPFGYYFNASKNFG
ncbi:hypothetical protein TSUD_319560 [Trifolium subterraneum]|uniref:RNase H type-1 domain-containing protein n=1 Tax=Trifolium subterraneum TaxID=3900 RepID=A0A2Z6MZA8_TRISU|nr:hypothetical protein TSUD_319560 [Trifolium subterraneum]